MKKTVIASKHLQQLVYYKTGQGPTLMLVHGFPANAELWRDVVPELAEHYTLLLPDFFSEPNIWMQHGETNTHLLSEAFKEILDHENVAKCTIFGHSMGGYMALAFAEKYPERLNGLSLVHSSPWPDDEARAEGRRKTINILEGGGKRMFLNKMVKALFPAHFNELRPEVYKRQTEEAIAVDDIALIAFYKAIMNRKPTMHVVKNANFPVQYIIGALDTLANITIDLANESLARTTFVTIAQDGGHMLMLEQPQLCARAMQAFAAFCLTSDKE